MIGSRDGAARAPDHHPQSMRQMVQLAVIAVVMVLVAAAFALAAIRGFLQVAPRVRVIQATGSNRPPVEFAENVAFVRKEIEWLAAPDRQGRDTPGPGLLAAQVRLARHFAALGLEPIEDRLDSGPVGGPLSELLRGFGLPPYAVPFDASRLELGRTVHVAPSTKSLLEVEGLGEFTLGVDFLPLATGFVGEATGPLRLVGYGIHSREERYDDIGGRDLEGAIGVIVEGEPRIADRFAGAESSAEASLWNKLDALEEAGAAGALVLRSPDAAGPFHFHKTRAGWMPPSFDRVRDQLPTLVLSRSAGARVLGTEVSALVSAISETAAPPDATQRRFSEGRAARIVARLERVDASEALSEKHRLANVCGLLRGTNGAGQPALLVCAHLDHIGIGPRGRVGFGADDNASGVAALMLIARRLADRRPARDVWFVGFSGEEDGLLGSRALSARIPSGTVELVVNLDMIGRGPTQEAVILRGAPDPTALNRLDELIEGAVLGAQHGLHAVRVVEDASFFTRSDHYSFHETGIASVFLFEDWPLREGIYHTWRDTAETVDPAKVVRTARLGEAILRRARPGMR